MPKYSRKILLPGVDAAEVFDRINRDIEKYKASQEGTLGPVDLRKDSDAKTFKLDSKWVNAQLFCEPGCVRLEANLSLLALPFRSKIDEGIDRWLKKNFPEAKLDA